MYRLISVCRTAVIPALFGAVLVGCSGADLDVKPVPSATQSGTTYVKITEVRDLRVFDAHPSDLETQSLQHQSDISNPAITSRAVMRDPDPDGAPFHDTLLSEGKTVAALVRSAAVRALQDRGYVVVDEQSPQYAAALPLRIDIERFWEWYTPKFIHSLVATIEFKSIVTLTGEGVVGQTPQTVTAYEMRHTEFLRSSVEKALIEQGLQTLSSLMSTHIKPASSAR